MQSEGQGARDRTPPSSHSNRSLAKGGPDPVALLEERGSDPGPGLMPAQRGRMMGEPFCFLVEGTQMNRVASATVLTGSVIDHAHLRH